MRLLFLAAILLCCLSFVSTGTFKKYNDKPLIIFEFVDEEEIARLGLERFANAPRTKRMKRGLWTDVAQAISVAQDVVQAIVTTFSNVDLVITDFNQGEKKGRQGFQDIGDGGKKMFSQFKALRIPG